MKNWILAGCAALTVLGFVSCAQSTPQTRIEQRPEAFERLSNKHQELVSRGEIAKGMSKDAVALAWGSPSGRVEGLRNGKAMERWDYTGSRPVVYNDFYGGYYGGRYGGYYGPYRYSRLGGGFGQHVAYIPYRKGSVWFVGDRVDEWERAH